jgi:hypothetical protein
MSYLVTDNFSTLKIDLLTPYNINGSGVFLLRPPATFETDISATTGGTQITLNSGSSYYLEASIQPRNSSRNGEMTAQFYNVTSSQYIGREVYFNFATSYAYVGRVGRKVASALILDSDISTSMVIDLRRTSQTGSNWSYSITTDVGIDGFNYVGYPSIRVWQLPS